MIEEKTSENRKKNKGVKAIILRFLVVLFFLGFIGIRAFSLLPGWGNIVDTYGFYSSAVIAQEQMAARLSSGISYAYTESLVNLMLIVGNVKWFVAIYHIVLQILTLILLITGCNLLFDKITAYVSGICMIVSPWVFRSIFLVSPENYYLFFWSVVFCLIGIYFRKGRKSGWCRNNTGEGFLLLLGFLTGVLCVWHYFSLSLVILIFYAMLRNASYVRERVKTQQNLLEMEMLAEKDADADEEKGNENDDPMSNVTQMTILVAGIFFGGYCTLMKYTGITGDFIVTQFKWWLSKLTLFDGYGRWQDIALWLFIQVLVVMLVGMVMVALQSSKENGKNTEEVEGTDVVERKEIAEVAEEIDDAEMVAAEEIVEANGFVGEVHSATNEDDWRFDIEVLNDDNWRFDNKENMRDEIVKNTEIKIESTKELKEEQTVKKVELLENPLPLPKKHEKKVMDFDNMAVKDDFDYGLRADDDFDV